MKAETRRAYEKALAKRICETCSNVYNASQCPRCEAEAEDDAPGVCPKTCGIRWNPEICRECRSAETRPLERKDLEFDREPPEEVFPEFAPILELLRFIARDANGGLVFTDLLAVLARCGIDRAEEDFVIDMLVAYSEGLRDGNMDRFEPVTKEE